MSGFTADIQRHRIFLIPINGLEIGIGQFLFTTDDSYHHLNFVCYMYYLSNRKVCTRSMYSLRPNISVAALV